MGRIVISFTVIIVSHTGVRYPAALLPEVVATLAIQVQLSGSCQGATPRRTDPISPIIPRYKARVYR